MSQTRSAKDPNKVITNTPVAHAQNGIMNALIRIIVY